MNNLKKAPQPAIPGTTTLVTPNGSLHSIEKLLLDDCPSLEILAINRHGRVKRTTAKNFEIVDFAPQVTTIVTTTGQQVSVSQRHTIILPNYEIVEAETLQPGDVVTTALFTPNKPNNIALTMDFILEVETNELEEPKPLYSFTLEDDYMGYFTGQILPNGVALFSLPKL